MPRLYFCTDLHGSEVCFRKMLHAPGVYGAEIVIMGGDCTGKMVVPFVRRDGGYWCAWEAGPKGNLANGEELEHAEKLIRDFGFYPIRLEPGEYEALQADPERLQEVFDELMLARLREWLELAEERLAGTGTQLILTPGNDDLVSVDDVLRESEFVLAPEGRIIRVAGDHELLSLSWSNLTPWDTPRECSEDELAKKIKELADEIELMETAIFNIHVPPHGYGLDVAPKVVEGGRLTHGGADRESVGSTAVRDAILEYQPMLSLHGHIHESRAAQRLGRTLCINPGSTYSEGSLQGVVIDIQDGAVKRYSLVRG
jgi:Icc-related predicted phosphoesterase